MSVRFGDFELDQERRQLLRSGQPVPLEPKAYELLSLLVERRPRALSKAQIRDVVWPGVSVTDTALGVEVNAIRQALGDEARQPRFIRTVHGFGYAFCGEAREHEDAETGAARDAVPQASGPAVAAVRRWRRRGTAWVVGGVVLVAAAAAALWYRHRGEQPAPRLVQLTLVRHAGTGSFSPDGSQVAFAAAGERGGDTDIWNTDIWLKIVGEAEARRLTTGPAHDCFPAWSPDGRQIAFLRLTPGVLGRGIHGIHLVSPLGGADRRLLDFPTWGPLSWSPDGRWLAVSRVRLKDETTPESVGIHLIPTAGGEPRAVTFPAPPATDEAPAFSPDGRALGYVSCSANPPTALLACDVHVLRLDGEGRPQEAARRLTRQRSWLITGLAWTRDGRSIVYAAGMVNPYSRLFRVRADGSSPPERVELAGQEAYYPFTVTTRDRLGFLRILGDVDIFRYRPGEEPAPLLASTAFETLPQYSPDGLRIAFESTREGETPEVWLADADGSNPTRLTRGPGQMQGSPRWSPDGRTIAFDSARADGRWDVWTIGVDGAGLRRVTPDPNDAVTGNWSRDGRWIYFSSDRTGRLEIWRVPVAGGAEEQLTREGGMNPVESLDGRTLYYMREDGDGPLLARPTAGGEERTILGCVGTRAYAADQDGLFYLGCLNSTIGDGSRYALRHWDARTAKDRLLATLDVGNSYEAVWGGLSVSPDGRTVLFPRATQSKDLMMIENFR